MTNLSIQLTKNSFENSKGYSQIKVFNKIELGKIKDHIHKIYIKKLNKIIGKIDNNYRIEDYHKLKISDDNHMKLWERKTRKADNQLTKMIKNSELFINLKNQFKNLNFSYVVREDDTLNNQPDIYWRLVRPFKKNDVGSIHADSWFWQLNNYPIKKNYKTFKVWCMLSENIINGLQVIDGSHEEIDKWKYKSKKIKSTMKPIFDDKNNQYILKDVETRYGNGIIFNENLLHCGKKNTFNETRVSIEFTLTFEYK